MNPQYHKLLNRDAVKALAKEERDRDKGIYGDGISSEREYVKGTIQSIGERMTEEDTAESITNWVLNEDSPK